MTGIGTVITTETETMIGTAGAVIGIMIVIMTDTGTMGITGSTVRYSQYPYGGYNQYPYGNNGYGRGYGYRGVLAPEWQAKFDSYYQRWLQYRATNNRDEVVSMERRMRDIMVNYRIPPNTPFEQIASPGIGYGYYRR
jgi:hypothetical protein